MAGAEGEGREGAGGQGAGLAALLTRRPWGLAVLGRVGLGTLVWCHGEVALEERPFLVLVSWMMASSLVLTGPLQLALARFAERCEGEGHPEALGPNVRGALALSGAAAVLLGGAAALLLPPGQLLHAGLLGAGVAALGAVWLLGAQLSGREDPRTVLSVYFFGALLTAGLPVALRGQGLEGMLGGFLGGQGAMLFAFSALLARRPLEGRGLSLAFLRNPGPLPPLATQGVLLPLALWLEALLLGPLSLAPALLAALALLGVRLVRPAGGRQWAGSMTSRDGGEQA